MILLIFMYLRQKVGAFLSTWLCLSLREAWCPVVPGVRLSKFPCPCSNSQMLPCAFGGTCARTSFFFLYSSRKRSGTAHFPYLPLVSRGLLLCVFIFYCFPFKSYSGLCSSVGGVGFVTFFQWLKASFFFFKFFIGF